MTSKLVNPFIDIEQAETIYDSFSTLRLPDIKELRMGEGNRTVKIGREGLWAGSKEFSNAPFKVGADGSFASSSVNSKTGSFTRSAGSTGNQSITGLGFPPKSIFVIGFLVNGTHIVHGFASPTASRNTQWDTVAGNYPAAQTNLIEYRVSAGNSIAATLASFDSDGFTINWSAVSNNFVLIWHAIG